MNKQEILDRLDIAAFYASELPGVNWNGADATNAHCAFHAPDENPSCSVNQRTGAFNCFACGAKGSIFDFAMKKYSLNFSDAMSLLAEKAGITGKTQKPERIHIYNDETGLPLYRKLIFKSGNKKSASFERYENGSWIKGLQGKPQTLYNLPRLKGDTGVVFLSESEKDADGLTGLNLLAVSSGGAESWKPEFAELLKEREVVILPHNDTAGRRYAEPAAQSLSGKAASIKIVDPVIFGSAKGADVSDWINQGGTREKLLELFRDAPEWEGLKEKDLVSMLPTLSDLAAMDLTVDYVLEGIIPEKAITILYGRGGRGKTTLMLQAGYCIAEGLPFEGLKTKQMPVVYCDYDNPLNVICDKAKRLGSSRNFHYWHNAFPEPKLSKMDKESWEILKRLPNNALLIFDTLKSCQGLDMNKDETMAFILERFRELRDLGFTIVVLHHTPRNEERPKNNTTITDNADHSIGILPLKSEEGENDKDGLLFFGCGEADKSRYPKHHIYLTFDGEVFERAQDPEDSKFQDMRNLIDALIKEGIQANQSRIVSVAKDKLNFNRPLTRSILNRGEGKHWKSTRIKEERNQKIYQLSSCQTLYTKTTEQLPENQLSGHSKTETLQSLEAVELSSCLDPSKTTEQLPENQLLGKPVFQGTSLTTGSIDLTGKDVEIFLD